MKKTKNSKISIVPIYRNICWILKYVIRFTPLLFAVEIIRTVFIVYHTYIDLNLARFIFEAVEHNEIRSCFFWLLLFSVLIF